MQTCTWQVKTVVTQVGLKTRQRPPCTPLLRILLFQGIAHGYGFDTAKTLYTLKLLSSTL